MGRVVGDKEGGRKTSTGQGRKRGVYGRVRERFRGRGGYYGKELGASGRREFAVERLLGEVAGKRVLPALQGGVVFRWG